jgi:hypothetical protein
LLEPANLRRELLDEACDLWDMYVEEGGEQKSVEPKP